MKPTKTREHFTIWTTREIIIPNMKVSQGLPQTGYNTGNGYVCVSEGEREHRNYTQWYPLHVSSRSLS
jgi:hypothetical protein